MMKMELKGWEELKKNLEALPNKIQRKVLRKAATAGAKLVADSAKAKVSRVGHYPSSRMRLGGIGSIKKMLKASPLTQYYLEHPEAMPKARKRKGIRSYQLRRPGTLKQGITYGVLSRNSKNYRAYTPQYNNDVEIMAVGFDKKAYYGAFLEKGFVHRGGKHVSASPMIRPALHENAQKVIDTMAAMLKQEIDRVRS